MPPPQMGLAAAGAKPCIAKSKTIGSRRAMTSTARFCASASTGPPPMVPAIAPSGPISALVPAFRGVEPESANTIASANRSPARALATISRGMSSSAVERLHACSLPSRRMGMVRMRLPVAWKTAFAMAGATAMIGVSPAPTLGESGRSSRWMFSLGTSDSLGTR